MNVPVTFHIPGALREFTAGRSTVQIDASPATVADALAAKNFTIDRRKVQLEEPIKQLGEFKVPVRLHRDVTAEITVNVVREE